MGDSEAISADCNRELLLWVALPEPFRPPQRATAAFEAISLRRALVKLLALAVPPMLATRSDVSIVLFMHLFQDSMNLVGIHAKYSLTCLLRESRIEI